MFDDPPHGLPPTPVLSGTLYLPVPDLDPVLERIGDRVALEWGPEVMDYGMREVAVRDPDGYLIAFTAPA